MNTTKKKGVRKYTDNQLDFLRKGYTCMSASDLTQAFNKRFGTSLTVSQIRVILGSHKIRSGRTGRFEKGHVPWNAGTRGLMTANRASFKPGHVPANIKPLGSERINSYGYIEIKVAESNPYTGCPTRHKLKHIHVWEKANGPLPKGHVVIFKDGNKLNCDLNNLALVNRAELLSLNLHKYHTTPDELKTSVMALAKLEVKSGFRLCPPRGRRKLNNKE